jgi:hypothetical protein
MPTVPRSPSRFVAPLLAAALMAGTGAVRAERGGDPSGDLSAASTLPIVVSVAVPAVLLVGAGVLVVRGVEVSADGVGWVVENSVDGAKTSLRFTGRAIGASAVAVGTVISVTAISTGWVLSTAGQAIAFIPNEIGKALLYNEKVSR